VSEPRQPGETVEVRADLADTAAAEIQTLLDSKYLDPAYPRETLQGFVAAVKEEEVKLTEVVDDD